MKTSKPVIAATVVAGVALLVVAGIYFADSASALPSFFPGHQAGSSTHHVKHGIAAVIVALALFAFAWFSTGPRKTDAAA
jgi:protein-S-isoprenylcysteine O-methyltransferase Ste14